MVSDGIINEITFAPGFNRNSTDLDSEGKWVEGDHIRFRYGKAEKIGGAVKQTIQQVCAASVSAFTGVPRDVLVWESNDGSVSYTAVATHEKVEFLTNGEIYDMTPIRTIACVSAAITTSSGSTDVIVSIPGHAAKAGDYVVFGSVGTTVGGLDLSGEWAIASVVDANSFIVSSPTAATATSANGGGDLTASFLLPIGRQSNGEATGYGTGTYGTSTYGTPRESGVEASLRSWSFVNWGEDVLMNPRGGKVYYWDRDTSVAASAGDPDRSEIRFTEVTAAPTVNNFILLSQPDRHLFSYGCTDVSGAYDPMLIRWSNQEDFNTWDPTVSIAGGGQNTAGSQRLQGGSKIICAAQTKNETVIFTDNNIHVQRFQGGDFVFGFDEIGDNVGIVSQHAAIDINGRLYWMSDSGFYVYDGAIRILPSTVDKYLFNPDSDGSLNLNQKEKVFVGSNQDFNEIIWLYPSRDSEEIDRYVIYNYLENIWYDGTFDRTVWKDKGILEKPIALDSSGILYNHETGKDNGGQALPFTLESSWIDVEDGGNMVFIDKYIPDFLQIPSGKKINLTLKYKKYPQDVEEFTKNYEIYSDTRMVNMRGRGRIFKIIFSASVTGTDFQVGSPRIQLKPDGRR